MNSEIFSLVLISFFAEGRREGVRFVLNQRSVNVPDRVEGVIVDERDVGCTIIADKVYHPTGRFVARIFIFENRVVIGRQGVVPSDESQLFESRPERSREAIIARFRNIYATSDIPRNYCRDSFISPSDSR